MHHRGLDLIGLANGSIVTGTSWPPIVSVLHTQDVHTARGAQFYSQHLIFAKTA